MLGQIFTHEMKPMEVEILVAEVGDTPEDDQIFHILYDGSVVDQDRFSVIGGDDDASGSRLAEACSPSVDLAYTAQAASRPRARPDGPFPAEDPAAAGLVLKRVGRGKSV